MKMIMKLVQKSESKKSHLYEQRYFASLIESSGICGGSEESNIQVIEQGLDSINVTFTTVRGYNELLQQQKRFEEQIEEEGGAEECDAFQNIKKKLNIKIHDLAVFEKKKILNIFKHRSNDQN
ncbi:MAG: hypothetical protein EZS28_002733 [Streblomastix strix]|uniref:Uncharacterized protein n=1 Tax=Streblomastix strix TaxID=222440 RepID=A0A5J4X4M8_9EUKA|nr:MAG: hypothetical protein EZS28_002733 [Streblomastix strix]